MAEFNVSCNCRDKLHALIIFLIILHNFLVFVYNVKIISQLIFFFITINGCTADNFIYYHVTDTQYYGTG